MDGPGVIALGVLVLVLTPIVAFDLRDRRIPDILVLLLGAAGIAYGVVREPGWGAAAWSCARLAIVAVLAGGTAWLLARSGRAARVGSGDAKMLVAACAWVGLEGAAAVAVLAGLLLGVGVAVGRVPDGGRRWSTPRPFAPMLAAALVAVAAAIELVR